MNKLTSIRIKYNDGTYLDGVPIGVLAQNVNYDNEHNLTQILGNIDINKNGTIQHQINEIAKTDTSLTHSGMSADAEAVGNKIRAIMSNAPDVVTSTSAMTDIEQIYVLSTDGMWYYYNGSAWVVGGEYGAVATDTTFTQSGAPADAKTVGNAISSLDYRIEELENGGNGWTSEQKSAVLAIARAIVYTVDNGSELYQDLYDALYAVRIRYKITNNLTRCTTTNAATSIMEGFTYSATITPTSGYEISTVKIYMGGTNITSTAYSNGVINIQETTGDIVITATASKILPDGYVALEYITADGNQYIDTGIAETENISAEYEYMLNADSRYGTGNHILSSTNVYMPFLRSTYTESTHARDLMVCTRGQNVSTETHYSWALNRKYSFKAFLNGSNNVLIDNEQVATIPLGATLSAENHFYLFAYGNLPNNAVYRFSGNLYFMNIYNSNGAMIHRYLPCLNSQNIAGLYDTVSKTFLHSGSGTELIAGGVA